MIPAARYAAAIEVLADIFSRHRPASEALADWGKAHRFAGSGDRNAIGTIVFDCLRKRSSLAWRIGSDTPRALALSACAFEAASPQEAARLFNGDKFAPAALTAQEQAALAAPRSLAEAPAPVRGDYPAWLDASLARVYGESRADYAAALAERAPVDLRVNTLKTDRARMLAQFEPYGATPGGLSPTAIRLPAPKGSARSPHIESDAAYQKGQVEIQDEGSQVAALLSGARPGEQIADLCAGGGGKTLALAAMMENRGQLYAWDQDRHRLKPIHQRLDRAGVRNVQVLAPGDREALAPLIGRLDRVVLDVPCTGTGTWRRKPDAKWRLKEAALAGREREQEAIIAFGASLLRPGGELVYITCSFLAEENEDRIEAFLLSETGRAFTPVDLAPRWKTLFGGERENGHGKLGSVRLTTLGDKTDSFFMCVTQNRTKS